MRGKQIKRIEDTCGINRSKKINWTITKAWREKKEKRISKILIWKNQISQKKKKKALLRGWNTWKKVNAWRWLCLSLPTAHVFRLSGAVTAEPKRCSRMSASGHCETSQKPLPVSIDGGLEAVLSMQMCWPGRWNCGPFYLPWWVYSLFSLPSSLFGKGMLLKLLEDLLLF